MRLRGDVRGERERAGSGRSRRRGEGGEGVGVGVSVGPVEFGFEEGPASDGADEALRAGERREGEGEGRARDGEGEGAVDRRVTNGDGVRGRSFARRVSGGGGDNDGVGSVDTAAEDMDLRADVCVDRRDICVVFETSEVVCGLERRNGPKGKGRLRQTMQASESEQGQRTKRGGSHNQDAPVVLINVQVRVNVDARQTRGQQDTGVGRL
jgi:hypothetical protein